MKKRKQPRKLLRVEKWCLTGILIMIFIFPLINLFVSSILSENNLQVEKVKKEIVAQEKKNQSLMMKINELASLDNIQAVAKENGLAFNNKNIKVINE